MILQTVHTWYYIILRGKTYERFGLWSSTPDFYMTSTWGVAYELLQSYTCRVANRKQSTTRNRRAVQNGSGQVSLSKLFHELGVFENESIPTKWYKLQFFIGMMMIGNLDLEVPANFQTNSLGVAWTLWCGEALNKLSDAPVSSLLAICYHNLAVIWRHAPGRADEKINGSAPIWTYQSGVFRSFWWFWLWWNFPTKGEELCRPLILSFKFPRCQSVATFDPLQKAEDENTLASFHVLGSTTSRNKRTHKWQIANEVKSKPESRWHSEVHTVVQHRIADAVAHVRCYWPSWCHRCWPNDQQNDMYLLFVCVCIQLYQVH